MKESFHKKAFLKDIHTIPPWVRNGDDLLKYCKHLHYLLLQEKAVNFWYQNNVPLSDEASNEVLKIYCAYDEVYDEDKSVFPPFEEVFS